jgi:hypothetical protein
VRDLWELQEAQERKDNRRRYEIRARLLAHIMIPCWFPDYDPAIYELDHRFSISSGYKHRIPLELISSRHNLQLLTPEENRRKGKKCSITIQELLADKPHPFLRHAAMVLRRMPLWKLKKASVHVHWRLRDRRETQR